MAFFLGTMVAFLLLPPPLPLVVRVAVFALRLVGGLWLRIQVEAGAESFSFARGEGGGV